ncbi:MAG: cytochrome d ubiquinol oxidase subunit II [Alphaproteobacteria bacterium]
MAESELALIWALLIAFAVFAYVCLDGFDLGVGILFPFVRDRAARDRMINTVAPVWDGNETWLVLGGGGLYAAFPLAYSILMPALYAPLIAMLLGLVFRGVALEFRFRSRRRRGWWDFAFFAGSLSAALCQGLALGAVVQGISVSGRAYAGGWFDWLTPFSLLTAASVAIGYALLGTTWLIWKTEGALQDRMFRYALPLAAAMLAAIGAVSLWTPFIDPEIERRWFSWSTLVFVWPVPALVLAVGFGFVLAVLARREALPYLLTLAWFLLSYVGLGISLFPSIVPPDVTIYQAAAPDDSLGFLLVGAGIMLPIILGYTGYAYWVFRGKVTGQEGYH